MNHEYMWETQIISDLKTLMWIVLIFNFFSAERFDKRWEYEGYEGRGFAFEYCQQLNGNDGITSKSIVIFIIAISYE